MNSLIALLVGVSLYAAPQEEILHVRAEGTAPGTDRSAIRRAVENARTAAIVECLETLSSSQDMRLFQPIFARIGEYVPTYEILTEKKADRQSYVEIDAEVRNDKLRRDVAALVFPGYLAAPRVGLFITREVGGAGGPTENVEDGEAAKALAQALRKREFEVVEPERLRAALNEEQRAALQAGKDEPAAHLGRALAADVVVVGAIRCTSEAPATGSNLLTNQADSSVRLIRTIRAEFSARLIRSDTGARIDELVVGAVVHGADPSEGSRLAVEDASAKMAAEIVPSCVLGLLAAVAPDMVMLTIEGLGRAAQGAGGAGAVVDEIEAVLKAGVGEASEGESVQRVYASEDLARLRVRFGEAVTPFADWLAEIEFEGFRLEIKQIVNRDLTMRVVARGAGAAKAGRD